MTIGEDSAVSGYYRGASLFLPRLKNPVYKPTYSDTNQLPITAWATDSSGSFSDETALLAAFHKYRITCWGVRFVSVGPPLTSAGRLILNTSVNETPTTDYSGPNAIAIKRLEIPIQPGMDVVWLSEPVDNRSQEFYDTQSTDAALLDRWSCCYAYVEGASSTTQIRCQLVINVELIAYNATFAARMMQPALDDNQPFMASVRNAMRSLGDVYTVNSSSLRDSSFVQSTLRTMSQKFLEGAGSVAGRAASSLALGRITSRFAGAAPSMPLLTWPGSS
jgi:hypothetical protein